jgi:DNA-binding MarR family transcriptional regulator
MTASRPARNDELADRIHSAAIRLLRSLRKVDSASGLTAPRLSILSVLVFGGPQTLGQLASAEQVKPPTMTRLVAALERDNLVRRETDRTDRRITRVHATRKGERVMWAGRARRVLDLARRLDSLSAKELRELDRAADVILRLSAS